MSSNEDSKNTAALRNNLKATVFFIVFFTIYNKAHKGKLFDNREPCTKAQAV